MDSISQFIPSSAPVALDANVAHVQALFRAEPRAHAVAVADDGRPAGVILREAALAAADTGQPASSLMTEAVALDASTSALEAARRIAGDPGRANDAFLVVEAGRVVGAGSLRGLLDGLADAQDPVRQTVRAAEQAGEQAFRTEFLDLVTEELKGPIEGVLAMSALLDRQPLGPDAHAHVRAIRDAGETLQRLLSNAADFTRADQGQLKLNMGPVLLRGLLDDIQADWLTRNQRVGVNLLVSYDGDPELSVITDGARLRQVLDSLIDPALINTAMGSVEVALKAVCGPDGVHVEGSVRDTGPGMSADKLARIFESGAYGDGSRLGVALARRIILALNGCIRAESNVGAGVTMLFDMMCEPAVASAPQQAQPAVHLGAAHILVVDDNATNRMVAEALVEMFDCTSECAEDGAEAVEIAASGRFDVILMDIKMPRMDGMSATRAIRALPGAAGLAPIIALTANVDPEDARSYLACGMCAVVEKPIKPDQLLQAINDALASSGQRQSAAA